MMLYSSVCSVGLAIERCCLYNYTISQNSPLSIWPLIAHHSSSFVIDVLGPDPLNDRE